MICVSFNIETKRKELGLTLDELGKLVGVSKSTVKKWESGYIKNMRRDKIISLAKALQVSPMDILLSVEQSDTYIVEDVSPSKDIINNYKDFAHSIFSKTIPRNFGVLCIKDKLYLVDAAQMNFTTK